MQDYTDTEIWDKFRNGEKSAFKRIYDDHIEYLYNYGRKVFQDTYTTEDAIQELFIEIWQKRSNLGPTNSIRRYLATSLRRKIVAIYKKESRIKPVDNFDQIDFNVELAIDQIIVNKEISDEIAGRLKKAFEQLSNRQREVIFLRFYEGMDYQQISEVTGIKYQSLRNLIATAVKRLRSELTLKVVFMLSQTFKILLNL